jgi:uncharacterized protein
MSHTTSPASPRHPDALVIMAKAPTPGRVKTRLCPPATPEEAAALYEAFLVDIGREFRDWDAPCDRYVAWSADGEGSVEQLQALVGDGFRWLEQRGADLTERMENVFVDLQQAGYRRVVMRNSDSPHLPPSMVLDAFHALQGGIVLGPDLDGGFYLVGLDMPPTGVFPRTMSHEGVLAATRANAEALGYSMASLESFLDVDTPEDLLTFWVEFGGRADVHHWATWQLLNEHPLIQRLRS